MPVNDDARLPKATEHDALMQEAWKRFYDALCIDDRYNPELRRQFMPVRLWSNLPEMQPGGCGRARSLATGESSSLGFVSS